MRNTYAWELYCVVVISSDIVKNFHGVLVRHMVCVFVILDAYCKLTLLIFCLLFYCLISITPLFSLGSRLIWFRAIGILANSLRPKIGNVYSDEGICECKLALQTLVWCYSLSSNYWLWNMMLPSSFSFFFFFLLPMNSCWKVLLLHKLHISFLTKSRRFRKLSII